MNIWNNFKSKIIALAPMDGYSDHAFRLCIRDLTKEVLLFTEFVSAEGLKHNFDKVKKKLYFDPIEKPIIAQIVGKDKEAFIKAGQYIEELGYDGIDINMGCPQRNVLKSGHGMGLRKNPKLAFELVELLSKNLNIPVSVKTRLGIYDHKDLEWFCKNCENAGAKALIIHARTYTQMFRDPVYWEPIYEVKEKLNIKVIGNGNVINLEDGFNKVKNLDGFMIGRAALSNPWVFLEKSKHPTCFKEKLVLIKKHVERIFDFEGDKIGCLKVRSHLVRYVRDLKDATKFREKLVRVLSKKEVFQILEEIALHENTIN